jgi:hypothetical protein
MDSDAALAKRVSFVLKHYERRSESVKRIPNVCFKIEEQWYRSVARSCAMPDGKGDAYREGFYFKWVDISSAYSIASSTSSREE